MSVVFRLATELRLPVVELLERVPFDELLMWNDFWFKQHQASLPEDQRTVVVRTPEAFTNAMNKLFRVGPRSKAGRGKKGR